MTAEADTHLTATVEPFAEQSWLILEQSWNPGWTATVDGSDLGAPVLIDGYANGWLLPASTEERTVELTWTPQRTLTFALWFSLIAGVGVLGLAIFGRRQAVTPDRPRRVAADGRVARLAVLAGLFVTFAFLAGPVPAVVALLVGSVGPRRRWLAPAIVLVAGAVVAGAIIALEWRYDYPPGPDWPDRFGWTAPLVWSGVAAVSAAAIADRRSVFHGRQRDPLTLTEHLRALG
jgi:arabinofuranan 3-O-arabinosyltransferase